MKNLKCKICKDNVVYIGNIENEKVFKCNNCNFIFINNIIVCESSILGGESEIERNAELAMEERLSRVRSPKTLLDFGCGHGMFVEFCKSKNIDAVGIDQNTELQLSTLTKKFDAITLIEVIEHLYNPLDILSKLSKHLNPGGTLYIESSFSDTELLCGRSSSDILSWWYFSPRVGHISIFDQKSMENLLSRCNLKLIESRFNPNVFRATKE